MSRDLLFNSNDWHSVQAGLRDKITEEIRALDGERILGTPLEDLADYFGEKYTLGVPELNKAEAVADQSEVEIDVSHDRTRSWSTPGPHFTTGTEVSLTVPFTGDARLFNVRPTSYTLNPPRGEIRNGQLILRIAGPKLESQNVKQEFDSEFGKIEGYLSNLRQSASQHNSSIKAHALQILKSRKDKLLSDRNLVAELGFPLRERAEQAKTYVAPQVRRKLTPQMPQASTAPFKPELALAGNDYEHILNVLENMVEVMERSPSAFQAIDEESLRSHFLVQLNGHYEGQASGETFNYEGKTDILLRVDGKNIFIGECKFWSGPKKLGETLDQLLSYSAWRDTKTALLIFNRQKNFTKVLGAIQPTISKHPNYKREIPIEGETRFRFVVSHKDDPSRELIVTILAFDIPCPNNKQAVDRTKPTP